MQNDDLGERQKRYEFVSRTNLVRRIPAIIRTDGKSFHQVTKQLFGSGYNQGFVDIMTQVATRVQKEIQGCDICFGQSDEISFLVTDYKTIETTPWFDYNKSKLETITASLASSVFTSLTNKVVMFDSRAFNVPQDDCVNNFIWRQNDSVRNAVQMAGREYFSHKQLNNKSCNNIQEMLFQEHGINFNDYPTIRKRGFCIVNGELDTEIPIFTKDRNYIQKFVDIRED